MTEKFEKTTFENLTFDLEKISYNEVLKSKQSVIFDTNFLFITFEFRIDLMSELSKLISPNCDLYIYEGTLEELKSVERKKDKNKKYLPLIAKMLKLYNFKIIKSKLRYVDDQIMENISDGILIATNDKELRQKIMAIPQRVLYMRNKTYLEIG